MMVKVVPKLLEIFEDKSKLPSSTKTLIAFSDFLSSYWLFLIFLFFILFLFIKIWKKTDG
jgi:type II secretory pathway component PulF